MNLQRLNWQQLLQIFCLTTSLIVTHRAVHAYQNPEEALLPVSHHHHELLGHSSAESDLPLSGLDCLSPNANFPRVRLPKSSRIVLEQNAPMSLSDEHSLVHPHLHEQSQTPHQLHSLQRPHHTFHPQSRPSFLDPSQFSRDSELLNSQLSEHAQNPSTTIDEEIRYDPETAVFYRVRKIRRRKKKKSGKNRNKNSPKLSSTTSSTTSTTSTTESPEPEEEPLQHHLEGPHYNHKPGPIPIVTVDNDNRVNFLPEDHFITIQDLHHQQQQQKHSDTSTTISPEVIAELLSRLNTHSHHRKHPHHKPEEPEVKVETTTPTPTPTLTTTKRSTNSYFEFSSTESSKVGVFNFSQEWNITASTHNHPSTTPTPPSKVTVSTPPTVFYFTSARPVPTSASGVTAAKVIGSPSSIRSTVSSQGSTSGSSLSHQRIAAIDSTRASVAVITFCVALLVLSATILLIMHREAVWNRFNSLRSTFLTNSSNSAHISSANCATHSQLSGGNVATVAISGPMSTGSLRSNVRRKPEMRQQVPAPAHHHQHHQVPPSIGSLQYRMGSFRGMDEMNSLRGTPTPPLQSSMTPTAMEGELIGQIIARHQSSMLDQYSPPFGSASDGCNLGDNPGSSPQRSKHSHYLSRVQRWVPKRPPLPDDLVIETTATTANDNNSDSTAPINDSHTKSRPTIKNDNLYSAPNSTQTEEQLNSKTNFTIANNSTFPRDYRSEC